MSLIFFILKVVFIILLTSLVLGFLAGIMVHFL